MTNRPLKLRGALLGALYLVPLSALAHPGAGASSGFAAGFMHPFGGADHLLAMFAVGLWAAQQGGRALWAVPATFVAVMLLGAALGMISGPVPVPLVEAGILTSVLVLGVLIATACRLPVAAGALLVGIFALFHGHAHGAEMPLSAAGIVYSAGFAVATAALHVAGVAAGIGAQHVRLRMLARVAGGAIAVGGLYLAAL
jgi:urease accessory protein